MSLVIAIKDKGRIILGADKQVSTGGTKDHTNTKIWKLDELSGALIGSVGSARASQVIQYSQVIDKNLITPNLDTAFVVKVLAPTLAASLSANGVVVEPSDGSKCDIMPNAFIFAYRDKAWTIWHDLSVSEITDYFAIGSGSEVARGALYATVGKNPFERIVTSIDAAAESTLYVDNGIDFLVTRVYETDQADINAALAPPVVKSKKPRTKKTAEKTEEVSIETEK
jgi:ATP-dependent protease HslVU (ClpYQ) peptidase subunit